MYYNIAINKHKTQKKVCLDLMYFIIQEIQCGFQILTLIVV